MWEAAARSHGKKWDGKSRKTPDHNGNKEAMKLHGKNSVVTHVSASALWLSLKSRSRSSRVASASWSNVRARDIVGRVAKKSTMRQRARMMEMSRIAIILIRMLPKLIRKGLSRLRSIACLTDREK